jgi:FkbM family methyltransferase
VNESIPTRGCRPATLRDWLAAYLRVRLGRLDRFSVVSKAREDLVRAIAREGDSILVAMSSGVRFSIPSWDTGLVGSTLRGVIFEPVLMSVFNHAISPGCCVVDGGAHIGLYTIAAAKQLHGDGIVISFEPDTRNFALLRRNVLLNGFGRIVRTEQLAIAESERVANLYRSPTISTRSSLFQAESDAGVSVRCTTLDHYIRSNSLPRVNVLKLDLEGAEPICIRGMEETLTSLSCLILEINDLRLQEQAVDPIQFVEQVKDLGGFGAVHVCDEQQGKLVLWDKGEGLKHSMSQFKYANIAFHRQSL